MLRLPTRLAWGNPKSSQCVYRVCLLDGVCNSSACSRCDLLPAIWTCACLTACLLEQYPQREHHHLHVHRDDDDDRWWRAASPLPWKTWYHSSMLLSFALKLGQDGAASQPTIGGKSNLVKLTHTHLGRASRGATRWSMSSIQLFRARERRTILRKSAHQIREHWKVLGKFC